MNSNYPIFKEEQFEIDQKIASGSFGDVYLYKNKKDKKIYAGKIIKENHNLDKKAIDKEIIILNQINHRAIVQFLGCFKNKDNKLVILTEYMPEGSLSKYTYESTDKLTSTQKKIWLLGISHAMMYLHMHGIIHRDLKSQNVLIDNDFYPKICDFGESRLFPYSITKSLNYESTSCIGSPLYMAPELYNDETILTSAIDVYAFGILANEIMSGKSPYHKKNYKNPFNIRKDVLKGCRPEFEGTSITPSMKELIEKCWDFDPKKRPTFNEIFHLLANDYSNDYVNGDIDTNAVIDYINKLKNDQLADLTQINNNKIEILEKSNECYLEIMKSIMKIPLLPKLAHISDLSIIEYSCLKGNLDLVKFLVKEMECKVEKKLLFLSCKSGNIELFDYIRIIVDIDINTRTKDGLHLLNFACISKNLKLVKYLFSFPNIDTNPIVPSSETTLLHSACSSGSIDIVKYLIFERKMNFNVVNKGGMTPLHCACESGNVELVFYLFTLQPPFDAKAVTSDGKNTLHYACKSGDISLVKYLISRNDHPDLTDKTNEEMTILHIATISRVTDLVKYIVSLENIDVNSKNSFKETAFDIAQNNNDKEIMNILREKMSKK